MPVYSYEGERVLTLLGWYYLPDMSTVTIASIMLLVMRCPDPFRSRQQLSVSLYTLCRAQDGEFFLI